MVEGGGRLPGGGSIYIVESAGQQRTVRSGAKVDCGQETAPRSRGTKQGIFDI